jgi:DNA-binding SARP family transcriptional activator/tetratricopeptide (TPR) repeat protein
LALSVDIRVLGSFEVEVDGRPVRVGSPQQRAVLALLVLRANDLVPTDAIVDALWPGGARRSAAGVVRTYVSRLRRVLAAAPQIDLVGRSPGYVLRFDPERVDAVRFERLVGAARGELEAGRLKLAAQGFEEAELLWRGEVLADMPGFEAVQPVRTRLHQLRLAAAEDSMDVELRLGRHARVVGKLEALTQDHPFRERLWAELIVALYRSGRQRDALGAYQQVRSMLVEQSGIEPGPGLQALERQVLDQAEELRWRPPTDDVPAPGASRASVTSLRFPTVFATQAADECFAGREREKVPLRDALDAAKTGQLTAVFVSGEAGIGKTALVAHVASGMREQGSAVVIGRADEGPAAAFQPLDEALSQWIAEDAPLIDPADARQLSLTIPAFAPAGRDPPASSDRRSLFAAIGRCIEALSARHRTPTVVVLEDLQWAAPAAIAALRYLLRHPPAAPVLLIATHRSTDVDRRHPLAELLAETRGLHDVWHVELGGLSDSEAAQMLEAWSGSPLDEAGRAFATQLNRTTGGNPLFALETLRHLAERGVISPDSQDSPESSDSSDSPDSPDDRRWPTLAVERFGVPAGVRDVVAQRLGQLPQSTIGVLQHASILGVAFPVSLLARVLDTTQVMVLDVLEPAVSAGLVVQDGRRRDRFTFSHAIVREALLDGLGPADRARSHWRTGEAIASMHAADLEPHLTAMAHHLAQGVHAGTVTVAVDASLRAGRYAMATGAFEAAATHFTTATELLDDAGAPDPELHYSAWFGLGFAAGALADSNLQRRSYLRAVSIAREQGWSQRLARAAIGFSAYVSSTGGSQRLGGDPDDHRVARHLLDEALATLEDTPTPERCFLLCLEAVRAVSLARSSRAGALATEAVSMASTLDNPVTRTVAEAALFWSQLGRPHRPDLATTVERALSPALSLDSQEAFVELVLPLLPLPALQLGQRTAFAAMRDRVASHPELSRRLHLRADIQMWDAAIALCSGSFDEARQLAQTLPGAPEWPAWESVRGLDAVVLAFERGKHGAVEGSLAAYLAAAPDAIAPRVILASAHVASGHRAATTEHLRILRQRHKLDELGWAAPIAYRHLAEIAVRLGDTRLAAELLPLLHDYSGQMLVSFLGATIDAAADRALGQLLIALDRLEEAIDHLRAALALEGSFGASALEARTLFWLADGLLRRDATGDASEARALLQRASTVARQLGMTSLHHDCNRGLGRGVRRRRYATTTPSEAVNVHLSQRDHGGS